MNAYPSWIHRIPEMIEALALAGAERIDRRLVETLFDLRRSAAKELLRRMGAGLCGHSLVISRGLLMARLREAYEHPGYRWEVERHERVERLIHESRAGHRRHTVIAIDENDRRRLAVQNVAGLPESIRLAPGQLLINFAGMEDLLRQLMLLLQACDNDFETLATLTQPPPRIGPKSGSAASHQLHRGVPEAM
ncbi:MAG: hypothetical protein FJW40_27200 [Acidobacteria bacterium]|nr:hypothetical protein [Acidobacteriota bacterium]